MTMWPHNRYYESLGEFIGDNRSEKDLIQVLHKAQEIFGYLPAEVQTFISEKMNVPLNKIQGVISFYNFFSTEPRGKFNVMICMGTACYVRGAEQILEVIKSELGISEGQTTPDGHFSLSSARCFGACALAPAVMINDSVYGNLTPEKTREIIAEYRKKR